MPFKCQEDSYLKEFVTCVTSCEPAELSKSSAKLDDSKEYIVDGKNILGFDVTLKDTIFFPEGGGQPYDTGILSGHDVVSVRRKGNEAILFVASKESNQKVLFNGGDEVHQTIDWKRRFDHMQQHTAQHLITAIANSHFQMPTTSWNLGPEVSFIEMDTPEITDETVQELEKLVNQKICERLPVNVTLRERDNLDDVRFHLEVPEDWSGPVRIVSIEGVDKNTCCGTHVKDLGDLQAIKFIGTQKGKKGKTQLYFLAGGRVFQYFDRCVKREKLLTQALKCPNDEMLLMIEKLQLNIKRLQKNCSSSIRDLAKLEAERCLKIVEKDKPKLFCCHRTEGEYDFISFFVKQIDQESVKDTLVFISITDDCLSKTSGGQFLLFGNSDMVTKAGEIAIKEFDCKGAVKQGRFQGRIILASKIPNLEKKLNELFTS